MTKQFLRCTILCLVAYCSWAFSFDTHCKDEALVIFNCHLENSNKVVSVCKIGTENSDEQEQYLQYTFGNIGKAELVFPKKNHIKNSQFSFDRQYGKEAGYLEYNLTFYVGSNKYEVYWTEVSKIDGVPREEVEISSGVGVFTSAGKRINLQCSKDVTQNLESANTIFVRNVDWANEQ
ncbi:MAG: hypothetical protein H0W44_08535 [Gammaproteobacteria bacterium]|nr:hypothetical protein [Gammaproteobacteria bacterium]